jgi:hypothetical protein
MYDMMLTCWAAVPEARPTFEYLFSFFDDYLTSSERKYEEQDHTIG